MTTGEVKFSVVIPAYNAERTLAEAIGSVLGQTHQGFEVIVVDDGSRDQTPAVATASGDSRVRLLRQENAGSSAARNRGIASAVGEYVSSLDADDLWLPGYLEEMGRALDTHPSAGFAYTEAWILDETQDRFLAATTARRHPAQTQSREQFIEQLLQHNFVHNSVTVRRSVFEALGGYDERITHGEDWELWLRIAICGYDSVRVARPLAIWRDRQNSLSTDPAAMAAAPDIVYRHLLERDDLPAHVSAQLQARLSERERRTRVPMRVYLAIRRAVGTLTRRARVRYLPSNPWHLRSAPPAEVANVFPELGLGRAAPAAGGRPESWPTSHAEETPAGEDGARREAKPSG